MKENKFSIAIVLFILTILIVPALFYLYAYKLDEWNNSSEGILPIILLFFSFLGFLILQGLYFNRVKIYQNRFWLLAIIFLFVTLLSAIFNFFNIYFFSFLYLTVFTYDVFFLKISRHLYRRYIKKNIVWFFLSLVLNIGLLLVVSSQINLKENINRLNDSISELKYKIYQDSLTIDSLENLPPTIVSIPENNNKGGFYISFLTNDSISGHYISPQGATYFLQGKRKMDSIQGVLININNITEETHFHFHINSDKQISGDFTIGNKKVRISENVIVNDSEEPQTEKPEPPKSENDKSTEPKETEDEKRNKNINEAIKNSYKY